jgi:hypothetical protein
MCLQFVFLLITRVTMWLRLSRREETWQTAEILILRATSSPYCNDGNCAAPRELGGPVSARGLAQRDP